MALFALVLFSAVQVLHVHASSDSDPLTTSHCSLCQVSHSAARPSVVLVQPIVLSAEIAEAVPQAQTRSRLNVEPAFIRPPPATI